MAIDVQSSERAGTKDYEAVAQAIVLARRPDGVSRAELTKLTGRDLSRWGTRMTHHPDWQKGHKLIQHQHPNGEWHYQIVGSSLPSAAVSEAVRAAEQGPAAGNGVAAPPSADKNSADSDRGRK